MSDRVSEKAMAAARAACPECQGRGCGSCRSRARALEAFAREYAAEELRRVAGLGWSDVCARANELEAGDA